jgi:class 3 adenylate cyclase
MALTNDPLASESAERLLVVDLHDGKDAAMSDPDDSSVAHVDRRLAAILSADVKEYGRLMGADDVGTVDMLTTYRTAMTALISEHRGRVVDAPGIIFWRSFPALWTPSSARSVSKRNSTRETLTCR